EKPNLRNATCHLYDVRQFPVLKGIAIDNRFNRDRHAPAIGKIPPCIIGITEHEGFVSQRRRPPIAPSNRSASPPPKIQGILEDEKKLEPPPLMAAISCGL